MDLHLLWKRIVRAAKLDVLLYEEVEADRSALGQASVVVILSSLAAGIGGMTATGLSSLIAVTATALFSWYLWAWLTYLIGTRFFPEPQTSADPGELLRTIGFSSSPGLIRILGVVPALTGAVNLVAGVWMLVAMVIAVRQALDYHSTWRAIGVCAVGWLVQLAILALVFSLLGSAGPSR